MATTGLIALLAVAAYTVVQRRRGATNADVRDRLGLRGASRRYWGVALLSCLAGAFLSAPTVTLIPEAVTGDPRVTLSAYADASLTAALVVAVAARLGLAAVAEEVLFRGLLCGVLFARLGLTRGNIAQTVAFMLPHLPLLAVSTGLWPLLAVQTLLSLLLGWLRFASGSIWPGTLIHVAANVVTALAFVAS